MVFIEKIGSAKEVITSALAKMKAQGIIPTNANALNTTAANHLNQLENIDPDPGTQYGVEGLLSERDALIDQLRRADNPSEIARIEDELAAINRQIEQAVIRGVAPVLIVPNLDFDPTIGIEPGISGPQATVQGGGRLEGQVNLPGSAETYIENSQLRVDEQFAWNNLDSRDQTIGDNTNDDPSDDFTAADVLQRPDDNVYLQPEGGSEIQKIGSEDAPIYYQANLEGDNPQVTYHIFYPYNDGPSGQNHEGDWERITVNLDPETLQPTTVLLSAHGHATEVPYHTLVDETTGQPIIYVAGGSHANYPTPGTHETNAPGFTGLVDQTVTIEDGKVINTGDQLTPVQEEDWYPEEGDTGVLWGQPGNPIANDNQLVGLGTDGPTGPSSDKGHQSAD